MIDIKNNKKDRDFHWYDLYTNWGYYNTGDGKMYGDYEGDGDGYRNMYGYGHRYGNRDGDGESRTK